MKSKDVELNAGQLCAGFLSALQQAEALVDEAWLLYRGRRFAGAYSRLVLAIEEIGKNRLFLYQAGLLHRGGPCNWQRFWTDFYSHKRKLQEAIVWAFVESEAPVANADHARECLMALGKQAVALDEQKQAGQYSDFENGSFACPQHRRFRAQAQWCLRFAYDLVRHIRRAYPPTLSDQEFSQIVHDKVCLAEAMGCFTNSASERGLPEVLAHMYSPIVLKDGQVPSDAEIDARIADRYNELRQRIPFTIDRLNASRDFQAFYLALRRTAGYPDWLVLGAVYNIAVNVRFREESTPIDEALLSRMREWKEGSKDEATPIHYFTNRQALENCLDMYLAAFLAGLGFLVTCDASNLNQIRRIAHHRLRLLTRDVPHDPVFVFNT